MPFRKIDYGQAFRTPGGDDGDCQVRALVYARGIRYPDAWDLLYRMQGEMRACSFMLDKSLEAGDERLGVIRKLPFPAQRGQKRMTAGEFCRQHPKGRFILRIANHLAGVVDGVLVDRWDCSRKCVYKAWEVREEGG